MSTSFNKILTRGTQSALANTAIENGKIRFAYDTGRVFIDNNNIRVEITDFCKDYTESGIKSIVSPLPKVYIASDTNKMMMYDSAAEQWVYLSGKNSDYSATSGTALYSTNAGTAIYAKNAPTYKGCTTAAAGTAGFVPRAAASQNKYVLRGDGSWGWAPYSDWAAQAGTALYSKSAGTANRAVNDAKGNGFLSNYAPLNSPLFTGMPSVPTPSESSNDTQIANTEYVTTAIANAVSNITGFDISIIKDGESLPETGVKGTFYLVTNSDGDADNSYDEYIWLDSSSSYEHIGSHQINIDGYLNGIDVSGTGNAITDIDISDDGSKLNIQKNASFLTKHPSVTLSSNSTYKFEPGAGNTFTAIDTVNLDEYGHLKSYRVKTIIMPNSVSTATNSGTAIYAKNAPTYKGCTTAAAGTAGFVPRAAASQNKYVLRGDGSWGWAPYSDWAAQAGTALYSKSAPTYKGATTAAAGTAGFVPSATTAQRALFLKGDGTWASVPTPQQVTHSVYAQNGVQVGSTASTAGYNGLLWVDTSAGSTAAVLKYRTSTSSTEWISVASVWS